MKMTRFRGYLFVQGAAVAVVALTFSLLENRQVAGLIASSAFILSSAGVLLYEFLFQKNNKSRLVIVSTGVFLLLFIFPIVTLRLFYWGVSFDEITLGSFLSARSLHKFSNYAFTVMLIAYLIAGIFEKKKGSN